jgi:MAP kinase substrate 1
MQRHHELQGPRPADLVITKKDSHNTEKKKKKRHHEPVIIYVESPKVVHVHPGEFKSVVQRLTGAAPSSSSGSGATLPTQFPFQLYGAGVANELDFSSRGALLQTPGASLQVPPVSGGASCGTGPGSFFSTHHQPISPAAFHFEDENMTPPELVAGRASSSVVPLF